MSTVWPVITAKGLIRKTNPTPAKALRQQGRTDPEIAKALGVSNPTVYRYLTLGKRKRSKLRKWGRKFIIEPETGRTFHYSGTAKNLKEALPWVMEKREEEKLMKKYPVATFLQGNA
ncbi:MAG TPA: helix-turn-helix domain-containing protein [Nitrospirales bacterium]|nr:hypothetical protein [Nitrospiraceae bacterium]HNP29608.1 helix-turn-helix domain-containing protein [Nitrospirales bacterium]